MASSRAQVTTPSSNSAVPYGRDRRTASRTCRATGPQGSARIAAASLRQSGRVPRSTAARMPASALAPIFEAAQAATLEITRTPGVTSTPGPSWVPHVTLCYSTSQQSRRTHHFCARQGADDPRDYDRQAQPRHSARGRPVLGLAAHRNHSPRPGQRELTCPVPPLISGPGRMRFDRLRMRKAWKSLAGVSIDTSAFVEIVSGSRPGCP
jgi:hypothetical protein